MRAGAANKRKPHPALASIPLTFLPVGAALLILQDRKLKDTSGSTPRRHYLLRTIFLFSAFLAGGCFYVGKDQAEDVLSRPLTKWSSRDCLTVMLSSMRNNIFDLQSPNIKVIATPYTAPVVAAINRLSQMKEHWADDETQRQIDTSLFLQAGLSFDWRTNRLMDSHGNYMGSRGRLDHLQFLLTLRNHSWPCNIPTQTIRFLVGGHMAYIDQPLATPADWPCYLPDITDLDRRIHLTNDRGLMLNPTFVWGRRNNQLTMEETLVVSFDLRSGERHLFDHSEEIELVIEGFDGPIKLSFPIAEILRVPVLPVETSAQTN